MIRPSNNAHIIDASMYIQDLTFSFLKAAQNEIALDSAHSVLASLRMNGQICGTEWTLHTANNQHLARVLTPELGSLSPINRGNYVSKSIDQAEALGITIQASLLGEDADSTQACTCSTSSAYALFTTFLSLESPIRCLDCFQPVPLYKLPVMPSGEYYELICWQADYQSCDSLQMNCRVLEKAATREIANPTSKLSIFGRENCTTLAALSGKPFYYYLYRGHGRSLSSEQNRPCPLCNQAWHLESPLHSLFDFKCDSCRLLSNHAWDLPLRTK